MLIGNYYEGLEFYREDKIIYGKFLVPHQVVTTCRSGGGQRDDLLFLGNHQGCEPAGHSHSLVAAIEPDVYHKNICLAHGLDPQRCALLGTAANMRLAAVKDLTFRDLTVVAAVTGGVEGNAGRAGDPAYGWEGQDGYEALKRPHEENSQAQERQASQESQESQDSQESQASGLNPNHGTINILLFINRPLTPGALARTLITITEAKSAALAELAVNSRYSNGLATGTGTDQIGVACKISKDQRPITSSGKHSKLGELIALCVIGALKEVLIRQNGMTTARQCSVRIHLERFHEISPGRHGLAKETLVNMVAAHLDDQTASLLRENYRGLFHDPMNVAQVAAMTAIRDKFNYGILPPSVYAEVMVHQAALLAVEAGGRTGEFTKYLERLTESPPENSDQGFIELAALAMAMGFNDKWQEL